jgi:putative two-component system response regulator
VRARIKTQLALYDQNRELEMKVIARTRDLELAQAEIVYSMQRLEYAQTEMLDRLAQAAELHDDTTGQHNYRVGNTSFLLAGSMGLSEFHCDMIRRASPLHDVGKIGIPDDILLKPSRLTELEYGVMRTHTTIGASILQSGKWMLVRIAETIALTHHERWDGSGYPHHMHSDDIPIEGQIVGIADVFDALTHPRPYKDAWTIEQALAEIEQYSNMHFSSSLVDAFLALEHTTLV